MKSMATRLGIRRLAFKFLVSTGLRAAVNRRQHRLKMRSLSEDLRLPANDFIVETSKGPARLRYWHRKPNHCAVSGIENLRSAWQWGLLAGRLLEPPLEAKEYQLVCRTSHFGDAHFEAAFRYVPGACRIYAIKNIARDYCHWVHRTSLTNPLSFGTRRNEAVELYQTFAQILARQFESVSLEPPSVCVELAVQPRLMTGDIQSSLDQFQHRYERLRRDLEEIQANNSKLEFPKLRLPR